MAERAPEASIDRIRDYARAQVARTSLRKVAKRAGVKVGATKKFIDGSTPYERNARLWKKWYIRETREGLAEAPDDALPAADAVAALELLLISLPEERRATGFREALDAFRRIYTGLGQTPPLWVVDLTGGDGDTGGEG